ncbi:hypothetical protein PHLGIDRAFT_403452 [Phlebiopsis gigantea 11061_1 CR5-6]|uniref:F-box domain-containing protein n=1 Tax=Phlebiopsis gigantea (strain 11061_1 CR5-6) TaxID=745531 RepID=A0A0C3SBF4_PHLG1|nr:hypothetical protein PHLGIDRAFT_403452 [Phlebiopsis gigantea 11061_1 CR5-6]
MADLPVELIDMILTEMYDLHAPNFQKAFFDGEVKQCNMAAQRGLGTCTLVCRTWRPLATRHLFRDFIYSFSYDLDDIQSSGVVEVSEPSSDQVGYWSTRPPVKTLAQFYAFLVENSHICRLVQRLRLCGVAPYYLTRISVPKTERRHPDEFTHHVPQELLARLVDMLPCVDALDLVDIDVAFTPRPARDAGGVVPVVTKRSLKLLSIRYSADASCTPFTFSETSTLNVLSSFGDVETLRIEPAVDYSPARLRTPAHLLTPMRLRATDVEIRIGLGEELKPTQVVDYLAQYPEVVRAMRRLHVDVSSEEPEDEATMYIRPWLPLMADRLEELVLQTHTQVRDNDPDLSSLIALRTLKLVVDFDRARGQNSDNDLGDSLVPFVKSLVLPPPQQRLRPLSFQLEAILRGSNNATRPIEHALSAALTEFVKVEDFEHVGVDYRFRSQRGTEAEKDQGCPFSIRVKGPCFMQVVS